MTIDQLPHYIAAAAIAWLPVGAVLTALGHALAAVPNKYVATVGNALNALTGDVGDFFKAYKNAQIAELAKKVETEK